MRALTALLSVALLVMLPSCSVLGDDDAESNVEYYTARVDSVRVPASVGAADTLSVGLRGTLGPNSCYRLEEIESERTASAVQLEVIGRHVMNTSCLTVIIPLNTTYEVVPPLKEGPFEITVQQPDGSELTCSVSVEK